MNVSVYAGLLALTLGGEPPSEPVAVQEHARFYELQALDPSFFGSPLFDAQLAADIAIARVSWLRQRPDDAPDFVVMVKAWGAPEGIAFYQANRNDTAGLGLPILEETSAPWQGNIYLGSLSQYDEANEGIDGFRFVWAQELGHRWGTFVGIDRPAPDTDLLRGRAQSHWSYFVDTDGSALEGNDWIDHGDGTFTTDHSKLGTAALYAPTDLYLMGLIPALAVPPFFAIENPQGTERTRSSPPEWRTNPDAPVTVRGTRRDVTIEEIRALVGARTPTFATAQRRFRVAVLVMTQAGSPLTAGQLARVEALIDVMQADFSANVDGLAAVEVAVGAPLSREAPVLALEVEQAGRSVTVDASGSRAAGELTFVWQFGTEAAGVSTSPTFAHTFGTTGAHAITVVAVDEFGGADTQELRVRVDPPADCGCTSARTPGTTVAHLFALAALVWLALRRRQRA